MDQKAEKPGQVSQRGPLLGPPKSNRAGTQQGAHQFGEILSLTHKGRSGLVVGNPTPPSCHFFFELLLP